MFKLWNYFILFNNILLMLVNIYLLINTRAKNNNKIIYNNLGETLFKFKNSDNFILKIIKKNYINISNYLNNKYNYIINNSLKIKKTSINYFFPKRRKKKIALYSVDLFSRSFHKKWLNNLLKEKFIIKFDKNKPDYLIYNVFGNEHLNPKYNNSIKISIFTENRIPDFNEADYAIGQYHINYLDRYFKNSIFLWYNLNNKSFNKSREKAIKSINRVKFCAAVISNNISTDRFRLKFINELDKYKKVDMGGKYNNNIGEIVKNKVEFLTSYKFSIAMENSEGDGYISEKIVDSFLAGTIPIYYGDYMIDEYINPKSFILINSEKNILEKIKYIKKIDNDDILYKSILKEKVLLVDNIKNKNEKELKDFLTNIFEQEKIKAKRKFC